MDKTIIDIIIKNIEKTLLNPQETIQHIKTIGNFIGLKKEKGKIQVTPQYVLISHFMFPSYIGRTILLTTTAAITLLPEENFQKKNENKKQNNTITKWFPFGNTTKTYE